VDIIKQNYKYSIEEGEIGHELHSLAPDLKPGEFLAEANFSYHPSEGYNNLNFDYPGILIDEVNNYLKVLPSGTKFLGATKCGIQTLTLPYELRFFNPKMPQIKRVSLDHIRQAVPVDDKLEQYNLFTGIHYYDAEGKELFKD
jgi:hypothetical protein